jgi:hypothetical protein
MGYVICRQESMFRKKWLVQENPEIWGERNYALLYCKEGDAKDAGRRSKKKIFIENGRAPRSNWTKLPFCLFGDPDTSRKRLSRLSSAVHRFDHSG